MTLRDLTRDAVERYFNTVLLVDERWQMLEEDVEDLTAPGLALASNEGSKSVESTGSGEPAGGDVDVVAMTDAFIRHGMHLAPVKPASEPTTSFDESIRAIAQNSDIVILDWNIYGDDGLRCLELAKDLAERSNDRLRVVAIYTGEQVNPVEDKLQEALELPAFEYGQSSKENLHVLVVAKPDSITATDEDRVSSEGDLPNRILAFVTDSLYGILPTVALNSLAAIRDNSQKLLAAFDVNLDPGYLGHRALLRHPEEAEDQLSAILADEFRAILEDPDVTRPGQIDAIRSWIDDPPRGFGQSDAPELLKNLHLYGNPWEWPVDGWGGGDRPANKSIYTSQPALAPLHAPDLEPNEGDERWSSYMSLSSTYRPEPPFLRLGTLLLEELEPNVHYWLCLMPLCDSVRIGGTRSFPLLRLEDQTGRVNERFNCIVSVKGTWIRLDVSPQIDQVHMVEFQAEGGVVSPVGGVFASIDERRFAWIANLRPDVAHRFAQSVGERIARIGLDESDWLRRWAKS